MPVDHFPSTHATWIDAQLTIAERSRAAGDAVGESHAVGALRTHLMERYHAALRAYVCGGSLRRLGEPDELVNGFFADRACRPGFLAQWRESRLPLRRWMMTGINLYGKARVRERTRDREQPTGDMAEAAPSEDATAERAFEHAWGLAVLNSALAAVHAELFASGRTDELAIFRRRVVSGESYETIAPSVGRSAQQCANATRLVTDRLREALREALRGEGMPEGEVHAALAELYEAFGIGKRTAGRG